MSGPTRWRSIGVIALALAASVPQSAAVANDGETTAPDLAKASPVVGNEFRVSGASATTSEHYPEIAHNSTTDQYLVVWSDERTYPTRKTDVWGQRLAADGTRIGSNFRINGPNSTNEVYHPAVTYNPISNQYLVVWVDLRHESTRGWDIYGQRVKANGNLAGENFRVSDAAGITNEGRPIVAHNPVSNQYMVAWVDNRDYADRGTDIYAQRVKSTGKLAGGNLRISGPAATADEDWPALAYNSAADQYLFVWIDTRDQGLRGREIYGQRVKATGRRAGGDFRVSGANAVKDEWMPAIAYNSTDNQYLAVWSDLRDYQALGAEIYGRRIKTTGKLAGGDFKISGPAAISDEHDPVVAHNTTDNRYLVAWKDARDSADRGSDIYGQRIKATGKPAGGDFRICSKAAGDREWFPAAVYNPADNQYLVVWADERNYGTRGWDIYGRRISG